MRLHHLAFLALALSSCATTTPDRWRDLICAGPTEAIPDDDPALELFREAEPDDLDSRKVALAIERVNSCD